MEWVTVAFVAYLVATAINLMCAVQAARSWRRARAKLDEYDEEMQRAFGLAEQYVRALGELSKRRQGEP